jgi:hypothetical protein
MTDFFEHSQKQIDAYERHEEFVKQRDREFAEAKENIYFRLAGHDKYYNAFNCKKFEDNVKMFGFDHIATAEEVQKQGLIFSKYAISLGHKYGHDLKRFNSKEELLGFVAGCNHTYNQMRLVKKLV